MKDRNIKEHLIKLREVLELNPNGYEFYPYECTNARSYVNKKAFPRVCDKHLLAHLDFQLLKELDYKEANFIRLLFIDFLILEL